MGIAYQKNLLFVFLIISIISCTHKNEETIPEPSASAAEVDSISIWISQGQNRTFDTAARYAALKKAHKRASLLAKDSIRSRYFSRLSVAYSALPDATLFRNMNKEAMLLAEETKDSVSMAETHWDLAAFFRKNAIADSAYYHFAAAEKMYAGLKNNVFSARMLYNMAAVQNDIRDYTGSEITTIRAIELLKPLNEHRRLYSCYTNLGSVAKELKEYDRALEYHNEALKYLRKDNTSGILEQSTKNNIGVLYLEQGQYRKAKTYFSDVTNYDSLFYRDPKLYAMALNNLARSKHKLNEKSELPSLFNISLKIQDSIGDIVGKSVSTYSLAEYFLTEGDTASALGNLQRSKLFAQQSSNNKRWLETLRMFPKVDPKNAARYTLEYATLSDSLQQQERKTRNKFARIRFETDEFIAENQLVIAENQLLARQKQLWTSIALGLVLLGAAVFIIINQRSKNQKLKFQQEQQANNQEIFNLLLSQKEKVEEAKQIEQKRISEELHDGVLGKMLGVRMILTGLNKKIDADAIAERMNAITVLQNVEGEVRTISHELSHAAYQKIHNFAKSIQDLSETVGNASGIAIDFNYAEYFDWDALSGDIKINVYRMVQESIQNSVKHADCRHIALNFKAYEKEFEITIADDGSGFEIKKGKKGIGMRNIASRISKIGGSWAIDSTIGTGTTITMNIPIVYHGSSPSVENELRKALPT